MPSNIELKAIMALGFEETKKLAFALINKFAPERIINQKDTFFNAKEGRLKLREENSTACLIAYNRSDIAGPKLSDFVKTPVEDSSEMIKLLDRSNGIIGTLSKERELYLFTKDNITSRIHLDKVNVGDSELWKEFIEFEVMISNESEIEAGEKIANYLKDYFKIQDSHLLEGAYFDIKELRN